MTLGLPTTAVIQNSHGLIKERSGPLHSSFSLGLGIRRKNREETTLAHLTLFWEQFSVFESLMLEDDSGNISKLFYQL